MGSKGHHIHSHHQSPLHHHRHKNGTPRTHDRTTNRARASQPLAHERAGGVWIVLSVPHLLHTPMEEPPPHRSAPTTTPRHTTDLEREHIHPSRHPRTSTSPTQEHICTPSHHPCTSCQTFDHSRKIYTHLVTWDTSKGESPQDIIRKDRHDQHHHHRHHRRRRTPPHPRRPPPPPHQLTPTNTNQPRRNHHRSQPMSPPPQQPHHRTTTAPAPRHARARTNPTAPGGGEGTPHGHHSIFPHHAFGCLQRMTIPV